jgi:DNA-binding transcriptional LysR family regulator
MNVTLRQVQAFVLTAQLGSLTRAAERMHVTQSAISVLIKQLEAVLGVRLFDRTTRTLRLTAAAEEALPTAERILVNQDRLITSLQGLAGRRRGQVSFAVTPAVAAGVMPRVLATFAREYPNVAVTMLDVAPDQLISKALDEEVEFSIGTVDGSHGEMVLTPLLRDHVGVVVRDGSPIAALESLSWSDIIDHPVIAIRKGSGIRALIDDTLAAQGKVLMPAYEVSLLATALAMVAEGLGASILPRYLITHLHTVGLTTRPLIDPVVTREISIITKARRSLSCAAEGFIEVMRRILA